MRIEDTLEPIASQLDAELAVFVNEHAAPGVAAGVIVDHALAWTAGGGFVDLRTAQVPTASTPFRVASITKTFTATALAQLVHDGSLSFDDALVRHLPELAAARNPFGSIDEVTIRRVLMHRSGLLAEPPLQDWATRDFPSIERTLEAAHLIEVVVPPDAADKYSNLGFQLLGEVVARVSGSTYRAHVAERILAPLGLHRSGFETPADAAVGYDRPLFSEEPPTSAGRKKPTDAEGGLWSSVEDLGRWIVFQLHGESSVLPVERLRELHRPAVINDDNWTSAQGLAWCHERRDDRVYVSHAGGTPGFSSRIVFSIADRIGAIVLANGAAPTGDLALRLADRAVAFRRDRPAVPSASLPIPVPSGYRELLGAYAWPEFDETVRIEWRAGALTLIWQDGTPPDPTLEHVEEDRFVVRGGRETGERCRFLRDADGEVRGVDLAGYPLERVRSVPQGSSD